MELRPFASADLDEVVTLWYRTWHATFPGLVHPQPLEAWRVRFRDEIAPVESIWVAELEGRIGGFLALDERRGYLDQLFVQPGARGRGVGGALLAKAKALCPTGLTLHTLEQNQRARIFWERHGFRLERAGVNPSTVSLTSSTAGRREPAASQRLLTQRCTGPSRDRVPASRRNRPLATGQLSSMQWTQRRSL